MHPSETPSIDVHWGLSQGTLEHRLYLLTHLGPGRFWEEHDEQEQVGQNLVSGSLLWIHGKRSILQPLCHYCR